MNSIPPFSFFYAKKSRKRSAVSPVISSIILIAITVTLGLGLWSYSNSQVNTTTETFANEVTDYVNYVNDRFVIVNMAFRHDEPVNDACNASNGIPESQCVTVWVYNHGDTPLKLESAFFGTSSSGMTDYTTNSIGLQSAIAPNTMGNFTMTNSPAGFTQGTTYYVKITSENGAQQTYFQGAD